MVDNKFSMTKVMKETIATKIDQRCSKHVLSLRTPCCIALLEVGHVRHHSLHLFRSAPLMFYMLFRGLFGHLCICFEVGNARRVM